MATSQHTIDFICATSGLAQRIAARKMFGEYALYVDGKVTALVCDNTLFVKPTSQGATLLGAVDLEPPYPGAKPHFRITEQLDDRELLQQVLLVTAEAMPKPKAKAVAPSKPSTSTAAKRPARTATRASTKGATKEASTSATAPRSSKASAPRSSKASAPRRPAR